MLHPHLAIGHPAEQPTCIIYLTTFILFRRHTVDRICSLVRKTTLSPRLPIRSKICQVAFLIRVQICAPMTGAVASHRALPRSAWRDIPQVHAYARARKGNPGTSTTQIYPSLGLKAIFRRVV